MPKRGENHHHEWIGRYFCQNKHKVMIANKTARPTIPLMAEKA